MTADDKQWASKYLLDPLNEPEPSAETGPGNSHGVYRQPPPSYPSPAPSPSIKQNATVHVRHASSNSRRSAYPSPPASASPRHERFPSVHRQEAFSGYHDDGKPQRRSMENSNSASATPSAGRRRGSSLGSRFPGDETHRPLDMIRRDSKRANRAPHLRKKHLPGPDTIDSLDTVGGAYHHGGPFDATLLARNTSFTSSPLEALKRSNEEALKATPKENIQDSLERHRPLDGTASVPAGMTDQFGRTFNYEEGADLMIEGNYKRWPHVTYLPEDLKGKGEPSYSIEKALKEHKEHSRRRVMSDGASGIEMTSRPKPTNVNNDDGIPGAKYLDQDVDVHRRNSTGRRVSDGLKRRLGSLRRKHKE
ncbi:MAG: hypothetical protein M1819_001903 [Sarea resinae]|nr:MAG: hypothetical protein M1819_001903 [Sarea resinae]